MEKYDFPLFENAKDFLKCFQGRVKFDLEELVRFCEQVHYTGSFFLDVESYGRSSEILGPLKDDLGSSFSQKDGRVYLRGKDYYLGGADLRSPEKIEMMFRKIPEFNGMLSQLGYLREPKNAEEAALVASIFDHLKHYLMIAFNAVYKKCLEHGNDETLRLCFSLCDSFTRSYYTCILQGKIDASPLGSDLVDMLKAEIDPRYLPGEIDFYREMDNPQRILLHSGNVIANTTKRYYIVVNPLSGATEPGLALRAISRECGRDVVAEVFPIRYSFYQDEDGEVQDFDSLLRFSVPRCFLALLPIREESPILILDDNVATGETLLKLKEILKERYCIVDISAIEARRIFYPNLDKKDDRTKESTMRALAFEPVGETRRNWAVNKFVNEYLIGNG